MPVLNVLPHLRITIIELPGARPIAVNFLGYIGDANGPRTGFDAAEEIGAAYLAHGPDFAARITGAWAAAIHDKVSEDVILAQDSLGIETFYFRADGNEVITSAEAVPLVNGPPLELIAEPYFADLLTFGTPNRKLTPFRGIRRLANGEVRVFGRNAERCLYPWRPSVGVPGNWESAAEQLRTLIDEALASTVAPEDRVLCELSGGLDSTTVFASAKRRSVDVSGLTTVSSAAGMLEDEHYARIVVQALDSPWHRLDTDPLPLCSIVATGPTDEPGGEMRVAVQSAYSDLVTRVAPSVVLTGAAGDVTFGYYGLTPAHLADPLTEWRLPSAYRRARDWSGYLDGARGPLSLLRQTAVPLWQAYRRGHGMACKGSVPDWLDRGFAARRKLFRLKRATLPRLGATVGRQYLWELILELAGQSQSTFRHDLSAPTRHPLLYRPLLEFALSLPPEMRALGRDDRRLQREALRGILPEEIRTRSTKGTSQESTEKDLMQSDVWWKAMTDRPRIVARGWVDESVWQKTMEGVRLGIYDGTLNLEAAMLTELWLRRMESNKGNGP